MTTTPSNHINFDYWLELAQNDPERFESLRSETLETCIKSSSDSQQIRLRGLQWRIDRIREKTKNPLVACIRISDMMWDTFTSLAHGYKHLQQLQQGHNNSLLKTRASATILPFKPH